MRLVNPTFLLPLCATARAIRPPGAQPLSTANSATKRSSGAPNGSSKRVTELYQEDWTPDTSKSITKGENQSAREDAGSVFLDDGWGVQAVTATAPSRAAGAKGKKGKKGEACVHDPHAGTTAPPWSRLALHSSGISTAWRVAMPLILPFRTESASLAKRRPAGWVSYQDHAAPPLSLVSKLQLPGFSVFSLVSHVTQVVICICLLAAEGKRSLGSPYVTKDSEAGLFGLTLLQQRLAADGEVA